MKDKERRVIMVDMDGTLTHSAWRNQWAPSNGGSWEQYHERCDEDKPTKIVQLVNELSKEYDIVISTARPESVFSETREWLLRNTEFVPIHIFCRNEDDQCKSPELKLKHIRRVQALGYNIALFIDDRADVCKMAAEHGIVPLLVDPDKQEFGYNQLNVTWNNDPKIQELKEFADIPIHKPTNITTAEIKFIGKSEESIKQKKPDQILKEAGEFFKERNDEYGDAWLRHGEIMSANFPDGITLKTEKDFFLYHCLVMDVVKTTRICNAMANEKDHPDSWKDKIVYSAMAKSQIMEEK